MLKPIAASDVIIGKPIEEALYDSDGRLLLTKGAVANSEIKNKLVQRGHKVVTPGATTLATKPTHSAPPSDSIFATTQHAAHTLSIILDDFRPGDIPLLSLNAFSRWQNACFRPVRLTRKR
ncbi:hypothetical protein [Paludibacterium denitrificans]|uniref:Uncharacterized protein n=1 Tax=Paludibacterium denitrificans TaxID=2675226 RepID=A0A844G7K4_9NEIS|nr:hypothetical protein [Paludibacterium denitrificans]MTD32326.1 hypothetical protein [Paludibacterium denitrificans]